MIFSSEQWDIIKHGLKKREAIIVQFPFYDTAVVDLAIKQLLKHGRKTRTMHKVIAFEIVQIAVGDGGFFRKLYKQRLAGEKSDLQVKRYIDASYRLEMLLGVDIPRI